jgi:hypothetical protein
MKDHYDFSTGVRGKYAGKVDTADVRPLNTTKSAERAGGVKTKNGTSRKTYGPNFAPGGSPSKLLKKK